MAQAPTWLAALTFDALGQKLGATALESVFSHGLRYVRGPTLDGSTVMATLAEMRFGTRTDHAVKLWGVAAAGHKVFQECSCGRWSSCGHVPALMLDLALSSDLVRATVAGADPSLALAALPSLRLAAHKRFIVDQIAARWLPPRAVERLESPEFSLVLPTLEGGGVLQQKSLAFDGSAALELRLRWPGRRALIDPAELDSTALPPADRQLLSLCNPLGGSRKGFKVSGTDASLVLHLLRERRVRLEASGAEITFRPEVVSPEIVATRLPRARLSLAVRTEDPFARLEDDLTDRPVEALEGRWRGHRVDLPAAETILFRGPYSFVWSPAEMSFFAVERAVDTDVAWQLQLHPAVELVGGHEREIIRRLRRSLRGREVTLALPTEGAGAIERPGFVLKVQGEVLALAASLEAVYTGQRFAVVHGAVASELQRDPDVEQQAAQTVRDLGFEWSGAERCFLAQDDRAVAFWGRVRETTGALAERGWQVLIPERLAKTHLGAPPRLAAEVRVRRGLLDVQLQRGSASPEELQRMLQALRRKERWVLLDDGAIVEIEGAVRDALGDVEGLIADDRPRATLPLHQLGRIGRLRDAGLSVTVDASWGRLRAQMEGERTPEEPAPAGLRAKLRAYQREALGWAVGLYDHALGGVLADDMGLGKTVVTLSLLQRLREQHGPAPSIVVCPTSIVANWLAECARFTPELRARSLHGLVASARAEALGTIEDVDLLVTTYTLLRNDEALLAACAWRVAIFDEAQSLKNASAATTRAAKSLRAHTRLCLSGTPIENRLSELWSVMEVANPGVLGSRRAFERGFERPITEGNDFGRAGLLRAIVRPFLLRRTKREVLSELPPRQEVNVVCALGDEHRRRYDALALVLRQEMRARTREGGRTGRGVAVLTALLRLRQMACDPRLIDATAKADGGKREEFVRRVRTLVDEGRRVLVFSQFVELLSLWRADLDRLGIAYAWLDGATKDRAAEVERFQQGVVPVFMVSLRAGGTGLNLTAADTVIHCDPWWNPAVEDQATDRAHRMGQTRAVTVYRLVAQGTVEDAVTALKARKREVTEAVMRDGAAVGDGLTEDALEALLDEVTSVVHPV